MRADKAGARERALELWVIGRDRWLWLMWAGWLRQEYSRLVYLDSDLLVLDNLDHLFDQVGLTT